MNELLFFLTTVVSFSMVVICYKLFGKVGMWVWMAIAVILANIEVAKCVNMFGLATALGNVVYGSSFLSTDILSELHGKEEAKRSVKIGFFVMICTTVLIQISLLFIPNQDDFANDAMHTLFTILPRLTVSSIICFYISNRIDIAMFHWISKHTNRLWIKNNGSTMVAQFFDTVLFSFAAFFGVFPVSTICEIVISAYFMKVLVAALDTPFLYFVTKTTKNKTQIA